MENPLDDFQRLYDTFGGPVQSPQGMPDSSVPDGIPPTPREYGCSESPYAGNTITLIVGGPLSPAAEPLPVRFYVHESLLLECSLWFQITLGMKSGSKNQEECTSLEAPWLEAKTRQVRLPEDRVADWEMLLRYLYSGGGQRNTLKSGRIMMQYRNELFVSLFRDQPGLQNVAIDTAVVRHFIWEQERRARKAASKTAAETAEHNVEPDETILEPTSPIEDQSLTASGSKYPDLPRSTHEHVGHGPHDPTSAEDPTRPSPPVLGPLIRLYILADKYEIEPFKYRPTDIHAAHCPRSASPNTSPCCCLSRHTLRMQIVSRIRSICYLTKVIPNREDINRLWSSVVKFEDDLMVKILGMYANLSSTATKRIFEEEEGDWHGQFMKDLVIKKAEVLRKRVSELEEELSFASRAKGGH